jgi:uncharacterized protein YjbI with pentapeptide repeats
VANPEQLEILKQGVEVWNQWRSENYHIAVDLSQANLSKNDLRKFDLIYANLSRANLTEADLSSAELNYANLTEADLSNANLSNGYFTHANLREANLRKADIRQTELSLANLTNASLRGANFLYSNLDKTNLTKADLSGANISRANLSNANLTRANLTGANLRGSNLWKANLSNVNFRGADLRGANLSNTDLMDANLSNTDLIGTSFNNADLSKARLTITHALNTDFENATLTGACIEFLNVNDQTNFQDVTCEYIYLKYDYKDNNYYDRRPHDRSHYFEPGDLARLVKQSLDTVDLIFREGIDWKAFFSSFVELQDETNGSVSIRAIENKDDGAFVIRLNVPAKFDKAKIETLAYEKYERDLALVEERYRERLGWKEEQIEFYRQNNTDLRETIKYLSQRPVHLENKVITNTQGDATMPGDRNIHMGQGDYREANVSGHGQYAERDINNYSAEQRQTLADAAAEIQALLEQLEKTYPPDTTTGKMQIATEAIATIDQDPKLTDRILSALMVGGTAALDSFLNHPAASFVIGALEDWQETKKKPD